MQYDKYSSLSSHFDVLSVLSLFRLQSGIFETILILFVVTVAPNTESEREELYLSLFITQKKGNKLVKRDFYACQGLNVQPTHTHTHTHNLPQSYDP